ncbi:hypothetical protein F4805DRAFT_459405 [Annulohypoxylon moriforme]|nr:hypothetical protein F4805DRAFT_459405 [Annulohypoxylon moriforme]
MASIDQKTGVDNTHKKYDQPLSISQHLNLSSTEPTHSRVDDFLQEPLDAGNRNVMLPDKCSDCVTAIAQSSERMRQKLENITHMFNESTKCGSSQPKTDNKTSDPTRNST